jgi:hypothetical protein
MMMTKKNVRRSTTSLFPVKMMLLRHVLPLICIATLVNGLATVVYGPQSRELLLLTAKIAAQEGINTWCICAPGTEKGCRNLMYGPDYAAGDKDEPGMVKPVSDGQDIQDALEKADSMVMICYDNPIEDKAVTTLLNAAGPNLSKIILLTKMGVTKAKGNFFGGSDEIKLVDCENYLRKTCEERKLDLSIVRAGVLKGGGPSEDGGAFGLDRCYYNTIIDIVESRTAMAHDQFTLGADCTRGDTIGIPNLFSQMGRKSSFDPLPSETNRIVVSSAVVGALMADKPIEFSVSAAKGQAPPTMDEWKEKFVVMT